MIIKFFTGLKEMFTGEAIDKQVQSFVESHNPNTIEERQRLTALYWQRKLSDGGFI